MPEIFLTFAEILATVLLLGIGAALALSAMLVIGAYFDPR